MDQAKKESILKQFEIVENSLKRAKITYEFDMDQHKEVVEVTLYELIKSYHQIENMVREIDPERFGKKRIEQPSLITPELDLDKLHICPHCGQLSCTSDHK